MKAYCFDMDGVLVDISERLRTANELSKEGYDFWRLFFSEDLIMLDKPRNVGIELLKDRAKLGSILIITGRPKRLKEITIDQLIRFAGVKPDGIFMRMDNDYRPSVRLKIELLTRAIKEGYELIELHEDDEEVLKEVKREFPWIKLYLHSDNSFKVYWDPERHSLIKYLR